MEVIVMINICFVKIQKHMDGRYLIRTPYQRCSITLQVVAIVAAEVKQKQ